MNGNVELLRFITNGLLLLGCLILVRRKKYNVILIALCSFLLMELYPLVLNPKGNLFSLFFYSSLVYFILVHKLYSNFLKTTTQLFLKIGIFTFVLVSIGLFIMALKDSTYQIIYHNIFANVLFMIYPILYLIHSLKQKNVYSPLYFNLSCVLLGYFILEIVLSILMSFLFKVELIWSIPIRPFRFCMVQLFYMCLIYFGWNLGRTQKV